MNVKIQSKGIAGGQNTGSCSGYAKYLEHENEEKIMSGMRQDVIPFYDSSARQVNRREVVRSLDSNTRQLHRDDAKFYSVIISFSEDEVKAMGESRLEILSNVHDVVENTMDLYARNFHCKGVRSHTDLKYYYTIHEYREGFTPGLHAHIIVSRKDVTNTLKLSPMSNHRGRSSGVIKRGFDRDTFYRSCEASFDKTIGFNRSLDMSYDYFNTMKHGNMERREEMIRELLKGREDIVEINETLISLIEMLANEVHVPEVQREYMRKMQAEPAEKKNMNRFWNTYHSYYKPLLSSVKDSCNAAFNMYSTAKSEYGLCSQNISERYDQLKTVYSEVDRLQKEINKAQTSKACVKIFGLLIAVVNPAPVLVLALVGCIFAESQKRASIRQIKALRAHAKNIRADLVKLQEKQSGLREVKVDSLKKYVHVKDERQAIKTEMNTLKEILKSAPSISEVALDELQRLIREGAHGRTVSHGQRFPKDLGASVYDAFSKACDRLSFELDLLSRNISFIPIIHPNGGVANFAICYKGHECYASDLYATEKIIHMLHKWEKMTGQPPAYVIQQKQEMREKFSHVYKQGQSIKMKV